MCGSVLIPSSEYTSSEYITRVCARFTNNNGGEVVALMFTFKDCIMKVWIKNKSTVKELIGPRDGEYAVTRIEPSTAYIYGRDRGKVIGRTISSVLNDGIAVCDEEENVVSDIQFVRHSIGKLKFDPYIGSSDTYTQFVIQSDALSGRAVAWLESRDEHDSIPVSELSYMIDIDERANPSVITDPYVLNILAEVHRLWMYSRYMSGSEYMYVTRTILTASDEGGIRLSVSIPSNGVYDSAVDGPVDSMKGHEAVRVRNMFHIIHPNIDLPDPIPEVTIERPAQR